MNGADVEVIVLLCGMLFDICCHPAEHLDREIRVDLQGWLKGTLAQCQLICDFFFNYRSIPNEQTALAIPCPTTSDAYRKRSAARLRSNRQPKIVAANLHSTAVPKDFWEVAGHSHPKSCARTSLQELACAREGLRTDFAKIELVVHEAWLLHWASLVVWKQHGWKWK